ncbi:hypothetical protein SI65_08133 [Aspergillus cristatus]|uniref:EF-hand domain-containing protein n=1 Tax=Aspergillus cristatus TaxID=573508 RepID=A0A1E3B878_ASPCR|nr:hypothetical protein SI65_08133 [Aspergillus cristatus]
MTRPGIAQKRLTSHRFHQIPETPAEDESMIANDVSIDIPLNEEDEHEHDHNQYGHGQEYQQQTQNGEHQNQQHDQDRTDAHSKSDSLSFFRYHGSVNNDEEGSEKTHLVPDCDASSTGRRRKSKNRRANNTHTNHTFNFNSSEDHTEPPSSANLTRFHCLYKSLINSSIIIRYLVYITPFAILIAIPIIVGATATPYATVGGVKLYWFFAWIEVVWLSLWVCKILARGLPYVFQSLWGVVSPGSRRYALVLRTLEIPISLVGWTGVSLVTFFPIMAYNPVQKAHGDTNHKPWEKSVKNILFALFVCGLIFLTEKMMILLISINYHRNQFDARIKKSKRHVQLLSTLYEASRTMFPMYCKEFYDEDAFICDSMLAAAGGTASSNSSFLRGRAGNIRNVGQNVNRFADQITEAFGNVAQEITGKHVFNPTAAHSIVTQALERRKSSEALARRLWMSFVIEGREALFLEDIAEVLGAGREGEAEEAFQLLDRDGNGDISLDEIILGVKEIGRMRRALHHSLHDVDQAIQVLDNLLLTVAGIVGVLVFVSFVTTGFGTVIAAGATSLLSLSFIFSTTAQEVLGSCIFLFVKHPFDVGDRVDISGRSYMVERISLLFTVFHCVSDHRITQTSNATLNTLWIDNITRADAMHENLTISVNFNTTFADIQSLRGEMEAFVRNKENCRDFQPHVDVGVLGVGDDTDRLQLRVDIRHKSNWANECVRASRRSKFICALVLAMKKLRIRGPGDDSIPSPEDEQPPASTNSSASSSLFHRRSQPSRQNTNTGRRPVTTTPASVSEFPDDTYQTPATSPERMRHVNAGVSMRYNTSTSAQQIISRGSSTGHRSRSTNPSEDNDNDHESNSPYQARYRPFSYQAYPGGASVGVEANGEPMPPEHSEPVMQESSYYYPYSHTETRYQPYRENGQGDSGAPVYDEVFGPAQGERERQEEQLKQEQQVQELLKLPSGLEYSDNESGHGLDPVSPLPPSPAGHSNGSRAGSEEQGIGKPRGPR